MRAALTVTGDPSSPEERSVDRAPPPRCDITVDSIDGVAEFRLTGQLDSPSADSARRKLATAVGLDRVLFDLSGLSYIDPVGVGVLVGAVRRVQEAQGLVVLVMAQKAVAQVLFASGVNHLVDFAQTPEEASQYLASGRSPSGLSSQ